MQNWQLQEAKDKLSQIIKEAQQGKPQIITNSNKEAVILLSMDDYKKLTKPKNKLSEALSMPELNEDEFIFERNNSLVRNIG